MTFFPVRSARAQIGVTGLALALSACSGLPSSGPTAHQILGQAAPKRNPARFHVVNLDEANLDALNAAAENASHDPRLGLLADVAPRGVIGPGDVLSINLYEVGVSLFSGSRATATGADAFDASAHGQQFAAATVDENGDVRVPFAGTIHVGGKTPNQVETLIEQQLSSQSQHPQVVVSLSEAIYSSVVITGDVHKPGRVTLTAGHERLVRRLSPALCA
jgi:polysaccharide biosynthesis/export protein